MSASDDSILPVGSVETALHMCKSPHTWQPYLESVMSDAWTIYSTSQGDKTPKRIQFQVNHIVVHLNPTETTCVYEGTVFWSGRYIPLDALGEAIEWRINDRMSMYGIQDEEEGWITTITAGKVTAVG